MINRRNLMKSTMAMTAAATMPVSLCLAAANMEERFVVIVLRGGMDGLHALVPYADRNYRNLRPKLWKSFEAPRKLIRLNDAFALHGKLKRLSELYKVGQLALFPATSTPYRERSHFDGQNVLEIGGRSPFELKDGWLNRAISELPKDDDDRLGLTIGSNLPLILQGEARIQTYGKSPFRETGEDFLNRLDYAYSDFPAFQKSLQTAMMSPQPDSNVMGGKTRKDSLADAAKSAAALLIKEKGPRVAVLEMGGWDTHFGQVGRLDRQFEALDDGIVALMDGLGASWKRTAVLVVSEFGRTAAENGTGGTDHGTGGLAILLGGAVRGGKIMGKWPGLAKGDLYQGRDVFPENNLDNVIAVILKEHLGLSDKTVRQKVLPKRELVPYGNLFI
ncbi:DUF1501 domain-containing protein [Sneathiella sp. P13V-1]|uniref:DUF1501 domain-containing protein n=1 Tax=Sneathiella sp. P13V-1 TaxID=2697366 RepID=UPI00187B697C|nr:DUF1501 domain-containing protein [Sneathiella sp. P13V-1]MBE7635548.1 DUF1501 domain-containing protein [Sneathiella sp. P13V-1]